MKTTSRKIARPIKAGLAAIAVAACANLAIDQLLQTDSSGFERWAVPARPGYASNYRETDDARQLLWARGPKHGESGEWFDLTGSPLDPERFDHGIGKDKIPAIDEPTFVAIQEEDELRKENIHDDSLVIGYFNNGEAKAYPIQILKYHELVNDVVGGRPVTVGW